MGAREGSLVQVPVQTARIGRSCPGLQRIPNRTLAFDEQIPRGDSFTSDMKPIWLKMSQ
jgi:hypothetical protein